MIQFEHMDLLGDTLEAICMEKAGILRPGVPVLHGVLDPEAYGALLARSAAEDTPVEPYETSVPFCVKNGFHQVAGSIPDQWRAGAAERR